MNDTLEKFRLTAADGTGYILLDFDKHRPRVWFEIGAKSEKPSVALMSRDEAREIARVLLGGTRKPSTVEATTSPPARPRPPANLKRNELTEESRQFPNAIWRDQ
jgi:hypothetical protein